MSSASTTTPQRPGPPAALLLRLESLLHQTSGFKTNDHLYAPLFRRLGYINASILSTQLRANYGAVKTILCSVVHAGDILRTFWTAFFMLMENDGKKRVTFIRGRLYQNNVDGWLADTEVNSLLPWLHCH